MTGKKNNITDMPYAKWLEQALHDISDIPVRGMVISCVLEDGNTNTYYWKTSMGDKILLSGLIQQDVMFDSLEANGIIQYDNDNGDDMEEDADGEEE